MELIVHRALHVLAISYTLILLAMSPFKITQNHIKCLKSDNTNKLAHYVPTK